MDDSHPSSSKLSLCDLPLPVCIPTNVSKYPSEWCLHDGIDHTAAAEPTLSEIASFENHLEPFVRVAQAVLGHLIFTANNFQKGPLHYGGYKWWPVNLMRVAKYGPPKPQEIALEILATQGARNDLSLGEIKALIYVSSRDGSPFLGVLDNLEEERRMTMRLHRFVGARRFGEKSTKYGWGGDLHQFKPILIKCLGLHEKFIESVGVPVGK